MAAQLEAKPVTRAPAHPAPVFEAPMVEIDRLSLWYGQKQALKDVTMAMPKHRITAYIGPSG